MQKNKKEKKRSRMITLGVIFVIVGMGMVWFHIPYSPVKRDFKKDVEKSKSENNLQASGRNFTEADFLNLPGPIQKYIKNSGYIGTPKMSYLTMEYHDVDFKQGKTGPVLKIDYLQYNFVKEPCRLALIDSSMVGIPFEGYDYYQNGTGGMKGVIAKVFTLFNQTGADMDKACLVTFLAESLFAPTILLQDYISFEEINDYEVKATIAYGGQTVSGVFKFNEQYEMIAFTTNDRAVAGTDGSMEYVPWSAICSDYQEAENKIKYPTKFQAVWNYPEGDLIYFDGTIDEISYGYVQ